MFAERHKDEKLAIALLIIEIGLTYCLVANRLWLRNENYKEQNQME